MGKQALKQSKKNIAGGGMVKKAAAKKTKAPAKKAVKKEKKEKAEHEELTAKEERLVREFLANGEIQCRAFMRVYPNYSYDMARTESSKVFAKLHIKRRIKELRDERNKRLEITADKVLAEIAKLAFFDPRDFFDADGRLKPIDELDPDHAAVIAGIETLHKIVGEDKDGVTVLTKIKLPDKGANLERLGRNLKLFTDKKELELNQPITVVVRKFGEDGNNPTK